MAAYDFPDTAGQPSDGSFTYTAPDGTLYEWNGYAWQVPDSGNPGGGGGGNFEIPTQALPPAGAADGDMFWCTDDGRLYIYYEDADTSQWVDASPDNTSEAVDSYWAKSGSTLSPIDTADSVDIGSGNITLNADGSGEFNKGVNFVQGTNYIRSDGYWRQKRATGTPADLLQTWASGVDAGDDGQGTQIRFLADGSASFAGAITRDATGDNHAFLVNRDNTQRMRIDPFGGIFIGDTSGDLTDANAKISLVADGSAEFAGGIDVGARDITSANGSGHSLFTNSTYSALFTQASAAASNSTVVYRVDKGTDLGNIQFEADGSAEFAGTVTAPNTFFNLEADDDTKYTTTTDEEGNETRVYNGAVLDVKERIQNVISRMDAIEANEVTDDATDSALLTLVASLSSRLDERDATIAALTTRITTLEIQSNGGN